MSLSISATAATVRQTAAPLSASTVQAATASTSADASNAPIADTVSLTNTLLNSLAPYKSNGSVLVNSPNYDYSSAVATGSASTVAYGDGGVPAATVAVPALGGEGAPSDGSTTPVLNDLSTSTQETGNVANGLAAGEGGVIAQSYEGVSIGDIEGSASVSLSNNLSGVKAQSIVGDITLQLGQALQADTTTDPTTGALSLTADGKNKLLTTVADILLGRNFTSYEAANGAQSLADSIDGTSKTITLSLQHSGDQTQIVTSVLPLGSPPSAGQSSWDGSSAATVNISLNTGTGNLGVDLHQHDVSSHETASAQHSDNIAQTLEDLVVPDVYTGGGHDVQSAAGGVLQETASSTSFTSVQSTLSVTLDDGSGSEEVISTLNEGRLRSNDVNEAAALGQSAQKELDSVNAVAAGLFGAVDTPLYLAVADGIDPAKEASPSKVAKTAPALNGSTGASPFITALNGALQLLQSVKPVPAKTGASAAKPTSATEGNLQSLSTSQEALRVSEGSTKVDLTQQLGENNAYLAALYFAPSAAKPSTDLSA